MDHTNNYTANDIQTGKGMSVLSYLGLLWLIPFFDNTRRNNPYVRFHMNQGLILLIISLIIQVIGAVVCAVLDFFWLSFISSIVGVAVDFVQFIIFAFEILGIVNVLKNTAKELPFIGFIQILK